MKIKNNAYVIVLGGSQDQIYIFSRIKKLGFNSICIDKKKNSIAKKFADRFINLDFKNTELIYRSIKRLNLTIVSVITMGADNPHLVAKLANLMNIRGGISLKTAEICKNKLKMKKIFKKIKIPTSNYIYTKNKTKINLFFKKFKKIIIKPINLAGSKGVFLIQNKNDLELSLKKLKKIIGNNLFLVEEYLDGRQISTETIISNKKINTLGFADRNYSDTKKFYPQVIENGGTVPSNNYKYKKGIDKIILKIVKEIDFNSGVIKGDFVIHKNKVKIIEFAGRLSGGDFSESLVPLSTGKNYVEDAIRISTGEKIDINKQKFKYKYYVANRYFFLPKGKLQKIKNINKIKNLKSIKKFKLFYKTGDRINDLIYHGSRAGVFIVKTKSKIQMNKIIDFVYKNLNFKISNKWVNGSPN